MDIDWRNFPHLNEGHRSIVLRMSTMLGPAACNDLLTANPAVQVQRIEAFGAMERMYTQQAERAFAQARDELVAEAMAESEKRSLAIAAERAALEQQAQVHQAAVNNTAAGSVEAAVTAALRAYNAEAGGARRERRVPVKLEVPKYSGKESDNLEHWFLAVTTAAQAQLIEDQVLMVAFALSFLNGRAKEWSYSKLMLDKNVFPTWDSFSRQLREAFQPPDMQVKLRARLLGCKQGKRSLHEFVQELQYLRAALTSDPLPESLLVTLFMEGLRQGPARLQLFRHIPPTLDQAIKEAFMEEYSHRSASGNSKGASPMELNNADLRNIRCYRCNEMGHLANRCPQGPRSERKGKGGKPGKASRKDSQGGKGGGKPAYPAKKGTTFDPRSGNVKPQ